MRYELDGDVWQIVQTDAQLHITTAGKTTVRTFKTAELARAQLDKLVTERIAVGYRRAHRDPRYAELEAAISSDPENPACYAIYGDWLQAEGDPRGALIALQISAEAEADKKLGAVAAKLLQEHADYFLGSLARHAEQGEQKEPAFTWRFGYIHRADLNYRVRRIDRTTGIIATVAEQNVTSSGVPLENVLQELLAHASGRFLVELWLSSSQRPQPAIDVLARRAPTSLRTLGARVGEVALAEVWPAVPDLRRLSITGRKVETGELELPKLERLDLSIDEMARSTTRMIARMPWSRLQHLGLTFGELGDASIDDVFTLLGRRDLSALGKLALINVRYPRELVLELAASPLAPQLESLVLSRNQLTDAHAFELAKHGARFPRLHHLDVTQNRLSAAGIAALRGLAANLRVMNQVVDGRLAR